MCLCIRLSGIRQLRLSEPLYVKVFRLRKVVPSLWLQELFFGFNWQRLNSRTCCLTKFTLSVKICILMNPKIFKVCPYGNLFFSTFTHYLRPMFKAIIGSHISCIHTSFPFSFEYPHCGFSSLSAVIVSFQRPFEQMTTYLTLTSKMPLTVRFQHAILITQFTRRFWLTVSMI